MNLLKGMCLCLGAKSLQSCPTLCNPMDCSPAGSSVYGISQGRIQESVAMFFPRDLPNPGIKLTFPGLAGRFFTTEPPRKPSYTPKF